MPPTKSTAKKRTRKRAPAKPDVPEPGPAETAAAVTTANDPAASSAGGGSPAAPGVTLPPSVGPDPRDPVAVATAAESGQLTDDPDEPTGVSAAARDVIAPPASKRKAGKVEIVHHDDGRTGALRFTGWGPGLHQGYVRLDPGDIKFPVEFSDAEHLEALTWQPEAALVDVDGHGEQRVEK